MPERIRHPVTQAESNHSAKKSERGPRIHFLRLLPFVLIVLAAFLCSRYAYQLVMIQGRSMEPSFHHMQLAVIDKRACDFERGDVVLFNCSGLNAVLVKRIAAIPGDTVHIRDGTLYVNGEVSTVYHQRGIFENAGTLADELRLGVGEYIVLGDNLAESKDSRDERVGVVCAEDIHGRVLASRSPNLKDE